MLLSSVAPTALQSISPSWFTFGLLLVIAFAWTRPFTVRDFDNRRMPVNPIAQVGFTLVYCLTYVALVLLIHGARPLVSGFFAAVGAIDFAARHIQPRADAAGGFAPLFALTILCWFQSLSLLREVERAILVYVYSARYRHSDVVMLGQHLAACPHNPTPEERAKNRQVLERLNVFLTDNDTRGLDLQVIGAWRKVETLLRHLKAWRDSGKLSLTPEEMAVFETVETAHERKTALALNIVRMLDHLSKGGGANATFQQVTDMLKSASGGDPDMVVAAEERALAAIREAASGTPEIGAVVDAASATAVPELRLSSGQLKQFLGQIESYFIAEYRILLSQVADLAAKGIVHEADAGARLESIRQVGFEGLGRLLTYRLNRILLVFTVTFLASLALFMFRAALGRLSGETPQVAAQQSMTMFATIALTLALATIVGAFVGSTRELAQAPRTPWGSYVLAGLFTVGMFLAVHGVRVSIGGPGVQAAAVRQIPASATIPPVATPSEVRTSATAAGQFARTPPLTRPPGFAQSLPWAIVPFVMTLAICLMARRERWPIGTQRVPAVVERIVDGVVLGVVIVAALVLVQKVVFPIIEANPALGIARPPQMAAAWRETLVPLNMVALQFSIGFLIGAMVLRDVRRAAHSRIVETAYAASPVRPAAPQVKTLPQPMPDVMPAA